MLINTDKAEILWDTDKYYLDNKNQEAGSFLRKYRSKFGVNDFNWQEDLLSTDTKNINIVGLHTKIFTSAIHIIFSVIKSYCFNQFKSYSRSCR